MVVKAIRVLLIFNLLVYCIVIGLIILKAINSDFLCEVIDTCDNLTSQ